MINRCTKKTTPNYASYGGAGISYPKEWDSFSVFLRDLGERPPGTTLDRIDSSLGYSKKNCRWATWKEQANNRKNNVPLTFNGKTQNTLSWAKELGINRTTIEERLRRGYTVEQALTHKKGRHLLGRARTPNVI